MITIIVAIADGNAIGNKGDLLYHLSADMKRFRKLTVGNTVLMGRKTFDSLPKGALPDRRNIVLTRNKSLQFAGAERFESLEEALNHCSPDEHIFIIGGAEIYRQSLPYADSMEITRIFAKPEEADTFFPDIITDEWEESAREDFKATDSCPYDYSFISYKRKNK